MQKASAGFQLRKWSSIYPDIQAPFPDDHLEKSLILDLDRSAPIKALGLLWKSESDDLFDPLGLIGPVVIIAKMLIQTLWERNFGWDDPLPHDLHDKWTQIARQLPTLKVLAIPRFMLGDKRAYGSCIYFTSVTSSGMVASRLMVAKSRILPLEKRRPTLARLELSAALLLANLQKRVVDCIDIQCPIYLWSDSTITLHWISGQPSSWNCFVANRVAEIQQFTQSAIWLHVPTADNPADYITRGLMPAPIANNLLWLHGPEWYLEPHHKWPQAIYSWKSCIPSVSSIVCTTPGVIWICEYLEGHDSLYSALKILVHCRRFMINYRLKKADRVKGFISSFDIRSIEVQLIRQIQIAEFPKDYDNLRTKTPIDGNFSLRYFKPKILDDEQLIGVGGRLKTLRFLSTENILHCGPTHLLAAVHSRYWPIGGRNKARSVVHKCLTGFRNKPTFAQQAMADLPAVRVTPSRPFANIGVDLLGPVYIKPPRKQDPIKSYIYVFVCMMTKAVHPELVMSLTTEAFIAALRRCQMRISAKHLLRQCHQLHRC
ncbi:uncharacterized protein LOC131687660 [Topomyia yanbarensis]|uniref:uncharacterized protein LOC131687660 n=1 Tax=Topomyia yanbarensis TaxID=2498891 RepID=UPI00273C17F2|nr:uncharacterized protein LOC131687660 [Topomyia yanbarensis]